jgi:hypothetical protein
MSGEQEIFVVHNVGKESVEVEIPDGFNQVIYSLGEGEKSGEKLKLMGNSSQVFIK